MKFNDTEFDGVVLKIPCIRTDDNHEVLDNAFKKIARIIEEEVKPHAKFSGVHPVWYRNRNELLHHHTKKDIRAEADRKEREKRQRQKKRIELIRDYKLIETEIKRASIMSFSEDHFHIGTDYYDWDDIFTGTAIKQSFIDEVNDRYSKSGLFQAFIDDQCFHHLLEYDVHEDDVSIPNDFAYHSNYGTLGLRLDRRFANIYHRDRKSGGFYYNQQPVFFDPESKRRFVDLRAGFEPSHKIYDLENVELRDVITRGGTKRKNMLTLWLDQYEINSQFGSSYFTHKSINL